MSRRLPILGFLPLLALLGCSRPTLPKVEEFQAFPHARGGTLTGYVGTAGAASPEMIIARFGQPLKTEEMSGTVLPTRILHFRALDREGKPCLVRLRFIGVCRDRATRPECFRLHEVSSSPE